MVFSVTVFYKLLVDNTINPKEHHTVAVRSVRRRF